MTPHQTKPAFTMLELVIAIAIVGILAATVLPRLSPDHSQNAADNILADIRYTQHLALLDDKYLHYNRKWQRRWWHITFSTCTDTDRFYMIGSNNNRTDNTNGTFTMSEAAIDPTDSKPMFWTSGQDCSGGGNGTVSERIFVSKRYGITDITPSGGCQPSPDTTKGYIGFDRLGRPQVGFSNSQYPDYSSYMTEDCNYTFTFKNGKSFSIIIEKETGYAYIDGQEDS